MIDRKYHWAIIGCGTIAPVFAQALHHCLDAKLVAVGSRDISRAKKFAETYAIPKHGTYEDIITDPHVDMVYIATTNDMHKYPATLALQSGKHVLCEKPLSITVSDAEELVNAARTNKLFLMEGMWTRFLPAYTALRQILDQQLIGEPRYIAADFGFKGMWSAERRLLNPKLFGGTLLDNGIYPLALTTDIFGCNPSRIKSVSTIGATGVDESFYGILDYGRGKTAQLSSSIILETPQEAIIVGEKGHIRIPRFWKATELYLTIGEKTEKISAPYVTSADTNYAPFKLTGFEHEATHVMECISSGLLESRIMPHEETIGIAKIMDEIRRQQLEPKPY